jgi:hypothetical protein
VTPTTRYMVFGSPAGIASNWERILSLAIPTGWGRQGQNLHRSLPKQQRDGVDYGHCVEAVDDDDAHDGMQKNVLAVD